MSLDRIRRKCALIATVATVLVTALPAFGATYRYVDWTSADPAQGTAAGTITLQDGSTVDVTFKAYQPDGSPGQLYGAQTSGGTNYWTPTSTYTGAEVSNAPNTTDIIQLAGAQTYVITLSQGIPNPIMAIVSLGKPGAPMLYKFSAFTAYKILSQGPGFFGSGSLFSVNSNRLQGTEGNGTIEFQGAYSTIGWSTEDAEVWNGFTLGVRVDDASPLPGAPSAQTTAATAITATGATLNGIVSSNGTATTVTFEVLRPADGFTATAPAAQSPLAAGASGAAVSSAVTGLACGTQYSYHTVAANASSTTNGNEVGFSTPACAGGGGGTPPLTGIVSVAVGSSHVCAVTTSGGVLCWGDNNAGELGDGSDVGRITPVYVTGLESGATAVVVGLAHACALTTTGGVKCWGSNSDGQLGDGTFQKRSTPVDVVGLTSGVTAITATGALGIHTCALLTGGGVKCWGDNFYGQVGDGTTVDRTTPVDVVGLTSGVASISAGGSHTCALLNSGEAKCWGDNFLGAVGNVALTRQPSPVGVPGVGAQLTQIAAGGSHSCGLTVAGALRCWGTNSNGELGDGTTTSTPSPVSVTGLGAVVTNVALGNGFSCAITTGGAMKCWGDNTPHTLGDGTSIDRTMPVTVAGLASGVSLIGAGLSKTCAVAGGTLKCWGDNDEGGLGDGTDPYATLPVSVVGLASGVSAITVGSAHACALTTGGAAKCWGSNLFANLGDGTTDDRSTPVGVTGIASGAVAIDAGDRHSCAVIGGGAKCWGANNSGQTGIGATGFAQMAPASVVGLTSGIASVSTGFAHGCALTAGGAVLCWGRNSEGQLGDGTTTQRTTPVPVTGLGSGVVAVSVGGFHTCALTATGGLKCWGRNIVGALGDGTLDNRPTPVDVSGLTSGVAAVSAGRDHTCARTAAGALKCWGNNSSGEVGDGTSDERTAPVDVLGLATGVGAIAAGTSHTCAVVNGVLQCWGDNSWGQLGDGTRYPRFVPAAVAGLAAGVTQVAAGTVSTCAITAAGGAKCWGWRESDIVGDAAPDFWRATPVDVVIASPDRLAIVRINDGLPIMGGVPFSVKVETRNAGSTGPLDTATTIQLTLSNGIGPLVGSASCVIPAKSHQCTITGLRLAQGQTGAMLTAHRASGANLIDGVSAAFSVFGSAAPLTLVNFQGLWWADPPGFESGWGINFTHQGDIIFATWFTYDAVGNPTWLIAVLQKSADGVYSGDVSTVTGVPYDAPVWDTSQVVETIVGTMTVTFSDATHGTLAYTVNGISQTKAIVPQIFASPVPSCVWGVQANLALATNYQDLWWATPPGSQSGWGVNFTHQGDIIFFTWFTYDAAGNPTWFIAVASKTGDGVFAGPIYTVVGNPFNAVPWDVSKQVETEVGSTTITFADGNHATFSYTINGVTQVKQITRQVFREPGTVCS